MSVGLSPLSATSDTPASTACPERRVFTQTPFERHTGSVRHVIDLHWAISNRPLFADLLSFDELVHDAIPVTAVGR